MKTTLLLMCLMGASALLSGCTTTTTAQTNQRPDVEITGERNSYSQRELMKRGQPTTAEALAAQDASVYLSGHR